MPADRRSSRSESGSRDWAGDWRSLFMLWGLPAAAMLVASLLEPQARAVVWTAMLLWTGGACLANARRCGRTHCRITGPFFIVMAAGVVAYSGDAAARWIYAVSRMRGRASLLTASAGASVMRASPTDSSMGSFTPCGHHFLFPVRYEWTRRRWLLSPAFGPEPGQWCRFSIEQDRQQQRRGLDRPNRMPRAALNIDPVSRPEFRRRSRKSAQRPRSAGQPDAESRPSKRPGAITSPHSRQGILRLQI